MASNSGKSGRKASTSNGNFAGLPSISSLRNGRLASYFGGSSSKSTKNMTTSLASKHQHQQQSQQAHIVQNNNNTLYYDQQAQQQLEQAAPYFASNPIQNSQLRDNGASMMTNGVSQQQVAARCLVENCRCEETNNKMQTATSHQLQHDQEEEDRDYSEQLRKSQMQAQMHNYVTSTHQNQQNKHHQSSRLNSHPIEQEKFARPTTSNNQTTTSTKQHHVNFGQRGSSSQQMSSRLSGQMESGGGGGDVDSDDGESTRKKKYLTAKYGQQQMNLIKKRLKIEMWLHEQLQELAAKSQTIGPDELDEIDIDLDQLLDMEDDGSRQNWLRKMLAPLSDLPEAQIQKFICDVLEQSKLL